MKTPSKSRAKFGKQLDAFVIEAVIDLVSLILELLVIL
jgi:hypothetical protein